MLEVKGLTLAYGELQVVKELNFEVQSKCTTLLLGANGAGKSTTLKAIAGLKTPISGAIRFKGNDITTHSASTRVKEGIYFMSEQGIFPTLTVFENIKTSAIAKGGRGYKERVEMALENFPEIKGRLKEVAGGLSGGQRKLVGLVRALASSPELLVLDEPSSGLSPKYVDEVIEKLEVLSREITLVIAEQNISFLKIADSINVMAGGCIVFQGGVESFDDNKAVSEAFFGLR